MNDVRLILKGDTLIALLSSEIDHHNARGVREAIDGAAGRMKPKKLILDFSRVQFVDSSGMGLIIGRYRLVQVLGSSVTIVNLPPKVEKVVLVAGLDKLVGFEKGVVYCGTDK